MAEHLDRSRDPDDSGFAYIQPLARSPSRSASRS